MTQSTIDSASASVVPVDNRRARLDAAIALFRSEASASGYVVEEVRLRLPVPDVDVLPRVIIAQQNVAASIPPTFPRSKHPRLLPSHPCATSSDQLAASICEQPYSNATDLKPFGTEPISALETNSGFDPGTSTGFKRTISGSVISHPVPARAISSKRECGASGRYASQVPQKKNSLKSIPFMPSKESSAMRDKDTQNDSNNTAFWKTVTGTNRGKAILRAAESMHRMCHGASRPKIRSPTVGEDTAEIETEAPITLVVHNSDTAKQEALDMAEPPENMLHINGHNIPESHVELLLSSAANISARERIPILKKAANSPGTKTSKAETKKIAARPQAIASGNLSRAKAVSVLQGKQHAPKGRKDLSTRHPSRSFTARPFRCHKCPSSFDRDGHLRVHILAVHEKKRPFVCQVCDASFGHSSSLLRHVRTVHQVSPAVGSGRYTLPSRFCQKSNDSETTKSEDLCETIEAKYEKHFRCSACGHAFHRVALLNRHIATRHPLKCSSPEKSVNM